MFQRFKLVLAISCLGIAGCDRHEPRERMLDQVYDLIEAAAFVERPLEVLDLDLADTNTKPYLAGGWEFRKHRTWGKGPFSDLEFSLLNTRDFELEFEVKPVLASSRSQLVISVEINAVEVGMFELVPERFRYFVDVPGDVLQAGRNRVRFRYSESVLPGAEALGVSWFGVRLEAVSKIPRPSVDERARILEIPFGARFDLFLDLASTSRLVADEWTVPRTGRLEVSFRSEGMNDEHVVVVEKSVGPRSISLPDFGHGGDRSIVHLGLRAVGGRSSTEASFGVSLVRPRIVASQPTSEPRETRRPRSIEAERPPNLVLYLIDTLRADRLGSYGSTKGLSPNLDRFANESLVFENSFAQSSWTKSSVASIFTGTSPLSHGTNNRLHVLDEALPTMPGILRDHGYRTLGVVTNVMVSDRFGFDRGFDQLLFLDQADADDVNQRIASWLEEQTPSDQPFFLYVHVMEPHDPYEPPDDVRQELAADVPRSLPTELGVVRAGLRDGSLRPSEVVPGLADLYDAEVKGVDRSFGSFRALLEAAGVYDDSVIFVLSDHGEEFFEHRDLGHGLQLWAEQLRVPLIMKPAGNFVPSRVAAAVQHLDILPSALDALGLEVPEDLDGQELGRFADDDVRADFDADREILSFIHMGRKRTPRISVIEGQWKLIADLFGDRLVNLKLFDVESDPGETHDLAAAAPIRRRYLATSLRRHLRTTGSKPVEEVDLDESLEQGLRALGYLDESEQ